MMSSGGGSIALCSSSIAHRGMANHDALAAAKGAVSSLALSAASTYSPHNIRVNVCVPGVVRCCSLQKARIQDIQGSVSAKKGGNVCSKMLHGGRFTMANVQCSAF